MRLPIGAGIVILAFAVGSLPFGAIVSRLFFRKDISQEGSGNIGAANVLRTLGRPAGILVLLLDAAKGFGPTYFAQDVGGLGLALAAGFAAIVGHCYSPWLRWKGGKGVATELGVLFALAWPAGVVFVGVWSVIVIACGYASVGSLVASFSSIPTLLLFDGGWAALYAIVVVALITWRHRENLRRLRAGRESRVIGASHSASNPGGLP
ncbi:MAG: glycerol-3-phosphate 1-O-acyltransferase PlsY [Vulcanimicrobiaceae bacterium]